MNARNVFRPERVPDMHSERVTDVRPERVTRAARNAFHTPGTRSTRNVIYYTILYTISVPEHVPAVRPERVPDVVEPWR
jgi:hypothetical protein